MIYTILIVLLWCTIGTLSYLPKVRKKFRYQVKLSRNEQKDDAVDLPQESSDSEKSYEKSAPVLDGTLAGD